MKITFFLFRYFLITTNSDTCPGMQRTSLHGAPVIAVLHKVAAQARRRSSLNTNTCHIAVFFARFAVSLIGERRVPFPSDNQGLSNVLTSNFCRARRGHQSRGSPRGALWQTPVHVPQMRQGLLLEGESSTSPDNRVRHAANALLHPLRIQEQPQGRSLQAHATRAPEILGVAAANAFPQILPNPGTRSLWSDQSASIMKLFGKVSDWSRSMDCFLDFRPGPKRVG